MEDLEVQSQVLDQLLRDYPNGLLEVDNQSEIDSAQDGERVIRGAWNFRKLSSNRTLPYSYVLDHPDKPWSESAFICNPRVSSEVRAGIMCRLVRDEMRHHLACSNIILDLEVIKVMVPVLKEVADFRERISRNPHWTPEALKVAYQENLLNHAQWANLQLVVSVEAIRWIKTNTPRLINLDNVAKNCWLDSEIIDELFPDRSRHIIQLANGGHLSDEELIEVIKNHEFLLPNYKALLLKGCKTADVMKAFIEYRPLEAKFLTFAELQYGKMDPASIEWFLDNKVINLDQVSNLRGVGSETLIKLIRDNKDKLIAEDLYKIVVHSYLVNFSYVDPEVLQEIPDVHCFLSNVELLHEPSLSKIKWKLGQSPDGRSGIILRAYVPDLENLKLLATKVDVLLPGSIRLNYEIDTETLQYINDNLTFSKYIVWNRLTRLVHQDLIIMYPQLPWNDKLLSSRKYYPSRRMMQTKRAKSTIN